MAAAKQRGNLILLWLAWLAGFSLCWAVLYYQEGPLNPDGAQVTLQTQPQEPARELHGPPQPAARPEAASEAESRPYALLGPQGLMTPPDINALAPTVNNRGRVVVEAREPEDLAAFTAPPVVYPKPAAPTTNLSPDPEGVKTVIAGKQQELLDDSAFKNALSRYEAELRDKNFTGRANQIPDQGLGALIKKYSRQHGVDARLVWAVMRHESGFNPRAVSPKGAMGLMQLIPGTAALMGVMDPFDPEENINGGVRYLKLCLVKFNHNVILALAAYNAGPDNVTKYQGCPPFAETRNYVLKVMRDYTGKTVALPYPVLAAGPGRPASGTAGAVPGSSEAPAPQESGLAWKIPTAKFKVAGPQWKVPLAATIMTHKIPPEVRQNPDVARLLVKHGAKKPSP